ncbi:MAG: FAD-binding oxidoreductase [Patulibacter sp.]|nr:FAD-binding oxidoreductase [Patulibacter sp.]
MAAAPDPQNPAATTVPRSASALPDADRDRFPVAWAGWADPAHREPLADDLLGLIRGAFGISGEPVAAPGEPAAVELPASSLSDASREALVATVGADHVLEDHDARLRHAGGKSTPDLLDVRGAALAEVPDAVVLPATPDEVQRVIEVCRDQRIAVVPFGGGTSVVGGLRALRGDLDAVIALDLRRLDLLVAIDPVDQTATLQAGLLTPQADALLRPHGFFVGHFPQSYERGSIGGYAATRSSGQASSGYGRFDAMVVGLRVATPSGELRLGGGPPNAAGPDLRQLVLGSEGTLGVITEVTIRVQPLPRAQRYEGWALPSFAAGSAALRDLARSGERPTVMRMSDEVETAMRLATVTEDAEGAAVAPDAPDAADGPDPAARCLVVVGWDGADAATVDGRAERAGEILRRHGGVAQGKEPGEAWKRGRFHAPYLRDALLDMGMLVETLETVTTWSKLDALRARLVPAIQEALTARHGAPVIVMSHVSHVYSEGASLYLTVVTKGGDDPAATIAIWEHGKQAAGDVLAAERASITHHHAVGTDHAPWMTAEIGALGVAIVQAVKDRLDPTNVMNPGKLLPG